MYTEGIIDTIQYLVEKGWIAQGQADVQIQNAANNKRKHIALAWLNEYFHLEPCDDGRFLIPGHIQDDLKKLKPYTVYFWDGESNPLGRPCIIWSDEEENAKFKARKEIYKYLAPEERERWNNTTAGFCGLFLHFSRIDEQRAYKFHRKHPDKKYYQL